MSAIQKEQIYIELRKYHTDEFPEKLSDKEMDNLLVSYRELEDKAIAMLLGLVNGKSEYQDMSADFLEFQQRIPQTVGLEQIEDKEHFQSKCLSLEHILHLGEKGNFALRKPRKVRVPIKPVDTTITRQLKK